MTPPPAPDQGGGCFTDGQKGGKSGREDSSGRVTSQGHQEMEKMPATGAPGVVLRGRETEEKGEWEGAKRVTPGF